MRFNSGDSRVSVFLLLLFLTTTNLEASRAIYVYPTANTTNLESFPSSDSSYYYSDIGGNSVSYSETHYIPLIVYRYPTAIWVPLLNGVLPVNAIVFRYVNGYPVYYCRVINNNQIYYGQLIINKGCLIPHQAKPIDDYQILVR